MCERMPLPGGGFAIVCVRRRKVRCSWCGKGTVEFECDGCDRKLCAGCRIHVPPDRDYCKAEKCRKLASEAARQLRLAL